MLTAEVGAEDVRWAKLALCQWAAASGTYAMATASYIMWLAPQIERVRVTYEAERQRLRAAALEGQHRRSADAVAQMAAAWTIFTLCVHRMEGLRPVDQAYGSTASWWGACACPAENALHSGSGARLTA